VDHNGMLIFHPGAWADRNFLRDPSHLDLEDVEGNAGVGGKKIDPALKK